jgi:peptide-methionine (S)-S-oxide reductase
MRSPDVVPRRLARMILAVARAGSGWPTFPLGARRRPDLTCALMRTALLAVAMLGSTFAFPACRGHHAQPAPAAVASAPAADPAASAPTTPKAMTEPSTPAPSNAPATAITPAKTSIATLANGCFWCTEAVLEQVDGVLDVTSGYMGGTVDDPSYQQVCSGTTGHAECVQVTFDPARVDYEALLEWFFRSHDPTTLNRQGADEGTQYRSAIFVHDDAQQATAKAVIQRLQPQFARPIVTEVTRASRFWPAEQYHQGYFRANPNQGYCRAVIAPKLKKLGLKDAH